MRSRSSSAARICVTLAERARGEVRDLHGRQRRSGVRECARPAEVVEVVAGALLVTSAGAEAGHRAVHGTFRGMLGPDAEPRADAGAERLQHDVRAAEEPARDRRVALQVDDDRLFAGRERFVPPGSGRAHRLAARLLDADHPCAERQQLPRGERARQVAREVHDEHPGQRLHCQRTYHYPSSVLAERPTAVEEKRRQILDAAVRVFARKGYHTSRVGDIAEEAGVAHGLLYHYFGSKDELLETIFHENWSVLLDRIAAVEETDEPVVEQLGHVAKIILRTWLHRARCRPHRRARVRPQPRGGAATRASSRSRSRRSSA